MADALKVFLILLGSFVILLTVLPLSRKEAWWVRIGDFPRLQLAVLAVCVAPAYWLSRGGGAAAGAFDIAFVSALGGCVLLQCYMMLPYTFLYRRQVQPSTGRGAGLSLVFANVLMENRDAHLLLEVIRRADPDIILAVETDEWWQARLKELEETHPYTVQHPLANTYGMLLYSRLELVGPQVEFIIQDDIPSIHTLARMGSGELIELHCVHPRPPFPTEDERSTERDAELLVVGRRVRDSARPVVVAGDLNDVAWSHTTTLFQDISGLLDPRVGRGFFNTFHAKIPLIRFPLDHFFHSNHFRLVDLRRLDYFGSDHFPVFIALSHEPDAETAQEEPRPDQDEREEAEEKIEKVTV